MADEQRKTPAPAAQTSAPALSTEALLAQALAQLTASNAKIAELMERQTEFNEFSKRNTPKRKTTMREFMKKHPQKRLKHPVYQNGREVNPSGLSQKTIDLLDTLATGHYCDGLVDVIRLQDGINGVNSRIHIMYNNKTLEQRMVLYMRFPTLTKMIEQIAAEMALLAGTPGAEGYNPKYAPVHEESAAIPDDEVEDDDNDK